MLHDVHILRVWVLCFLWDDTGTTMICMRNGTGGAAFKQKGGGRLLYSFSMTCLKMVVSKKSSSLSHFSFRLMSQNCSNFPSLAWTKVSGRSPTSTFPPSRMVLYGFGSGPISLLPVTCKIASSKVSAPSLHHFNAVNIKSSKRNYVYSKKNQNKNLHKTKILIYIKLGCPGST